MMPVFRGFHISDVTESEFTSYDDKLAPQAVIVAEGLCNDANVDVFWSSVADRLTKLCVTVIAQTYKNAVCIIVQMQKEVIPCTIYS